MKSKVYFSKTITPEKVLEMYKLVEKPADGMYPLSPPLRRTAHRR